MRPLPYSSGLGKGKIGDTLDLILEHLRAREPVAAPGTLYSKTSRGVARSTRGRSNEVDPRAVPQPGVIQSVWADTLQVLLGSGETVTVQKPPHLRLYDLPVYDSGILTDFQNGYSVPSPPTYKGHFTFDYQMRTDSTDSPYDQITESAEGAADGWEGGAQSKFRLVHAPFRDNEVATGVWDNRYSMIEVVWPPYYAPAGYGGDNGPLGSDDIYVAKIGGEWIDVNIHARRWKPIHEVSGEGLGWTLEIGGIRYKTISTNFSEQRV